MTWLDEVENDLPAGRELDALIAGRVMGGFKDLEKDSGKAVFMVIPHYSTDIAAAWEVVEKLKTIPGKPEEWGPEFKEPFPIVMSFEDAQWVVHWSPTYWVSEYRSEANTLPHAICLAALKAVSAI